MKKVKLLSTMALAAVLSAGSVLPVFAYTADGAWSDEQHTTFGIQEGTATDFANQASFEVPLYVTMAAIDKTNKGSFDPTKLVTPKGYDIKNSSTAAESYIAVRSLDVEMNQNATWKIITYGQTPGTAKEMTFKIGNLTLTAQEKGTTLIYGTKDVQTKNVDLADGIFAKTDGSLYPLGAQEYMSSHSKTSGSGIALEGTVQETTRSNDGTGTAAQFRVVYHMVPTDKQGAVKTAAAYIGDNKEEAGYK